MADTPEKQELHPEILLDGKVIVDDYEQAIRSGEVNVPIHSQILRSKDIYATLGEIIAGLEKGRETVEEITVFDSTGLAIQDMASARYIYDKCIEKGLGTKTKLI